MKNSVLKQMLIVMSRFGFTALMAAFAAPAFAQYPAKPVRLVVQGYFVVASASEPISDFVQKEIPRWVKVVKEANVKVQ